MTVLKLTSLGPPKLLNWIWWALSAVDLPLPLCPYDKRMCWMNDVERIRHVRVSLGRRRPACLPVPDKYCFQRTETVFFVAKILTATFINALFCFCPVLSQILSLFLLSCFNVMERITLRGRLGGVECAGSRGRQITVITEVQLICSAWM